MDFFKGRKAVIATKHKKDLVIAPLLEKELGLVCITPQDLDTDLLGTFSGEVERIGDPVAILRSKCRMAMDATGINIAVANEGSFGAHPGIFFAPADDEMIMLTDRDNGIEIIERELSLETNFDAAEIRSVDDLIVFATKIGFPSHGIILKKAKNNFSGMTKENRSREELIQNYHKIKNADGAAYAETDMRAMHNPTRMKVIETLTHKLVSKIKSICPQCSTPGFGVEDAPKGLPCAMCGLPTRSTLKHIYRCHKCNFQQEKMFPFEKKAEDPQYCDFCNP